MHGAVRSALVSSGIAEQNIKDHLDADWEKGSVWVKRKETGRSVATNVIFARMPKNSVGFVIVAGAANTAGIPGVSEQRLGDLIHEANSVELGRSGS